MATQLKEEKAVSTEREDTYYSGGVEPRYSKKYEPIISMVIVLGALTILGAAILISGVL
jgi:hypothetical protein